MPIKVPDITGKKFGRLTVVRRSAVAIRGSYHWICRCDCGKETLVLNCQLVGEDTESCGCVRKHGLRYTHEYKVWSQMIQRCTNPNNPDFADYGGRGITVCDEWLNSVETFVQDMGICPDNRTLDRRNNNLGYCKENCHWATRRTQARNHRRNKWLNYDGKTMIVADWASELRIPADRIYQRLRRGLPVEMALAR